MSGRRPFCLRFVIGGRSDANGLPQAVREASREGSLLVAAGSAASMHNNDLRFIIV
jgi:hypothetical protein